MQTFPRTTATRIEDPTYPSMLVSPAPDDASSIQPTVASDSQGEPFQDGLLLQGRSYSETSSSPRGAHPAQMVAPGESKVSRHHSSNSERRRAATDARKTTIKRFPTIMTPSYGPLGGRNSNGISRGLLLRQQFYSKTEKLTVLSPDMEAKIYERICRSLGEKYGSLERATRAAVTIQKAYRGYKMRKYFDEIRREGTVQLSRSGSLDSKERRRFLSIMKDKAAAGTGTTRPMEGSHGDLQSNTCSEDAQNQESVPGSEGVWHQREGVVVVVRRTKSQNAVLTRRIREEEEDGEEDCGGIINWNRTVGAHLFNRKPASGIQYLISKGIVRDTPKSVARFLREQNGLSKLKIGEFVGEIRYEFNMAVLEYLAQSVEMKDKSIDEALRAFQKLFLMPGEAQKIDKIMQTFAAEYVKVNKGVFETEDAAYVLSFSIMMLHTSLHNPSVKKRTTKEQWLKMNRGINGGGNFPVPFLLGIYDRIQKTPFVTGRDHTQQVIEIQQRLVGSDILKSSAPHRCLVDEVGVFEMDKVNHWLKGKHKRVLLMFNDLVVVTKKNKEQYMFKQSFSLLNATAVSFQTSHKHGIQIYSSVDKTLLFQCCCKTKLEHDRLLKNFNDTVKLLNVLEKERITASQEQPHRHTNIGLPCMKVAADFASVQPHSMATSVDFLPSVGSLQCGMEITLSLRPLSATNLAMPLEDLHHLDEVSKSLEDRHQKDNVGRSLSSFSRDDNVEREMSAMEQPVSEQKAREARSSLMKVDRVLCGDDMDDLNKLIPYACHTSTVGVAIQV